MRHLVNFVHSFGLINLFLLFFFLSNLFTFALYGIDKRRAVKNKWRISEGTLLFFTLALGGIGAFFGMYFLRHKTKKLKFKISVVLGVVIALIPIIHIAHSLTLDRIIQYIELDFYSEAWPSELDGYRIAFMTDKHSITDEDMANVIAELNDRNLDLLLLGGDFSSDVFRGGNHYQGTVREISRAITTDGIFGVDGNHDHYARLFYAKEQYGIIPLGNTGLEIREGFYLAGVHDLWNRDNNNVKEADVADAIAGANSDDFILLISHNPDISMEQSTAGIDLIVAGHTHGGQITFFGFPFYLLRGGITNYGLRFAHGFNYSADGVPLFTSRGVGPYYNWPRIFARPEVVIFTMRSTNALSSSGALDSTSSLDSE